MNEVNQFDRIPLLSELIQEAKYSEYLDEIGKKHPEFEILISKIKDPNLCLSEWKSLMIRINDINNLKHLVNPYFIGYGNPNSEILIIGKEKAFDISSSTDLLFLESINNVSQWKKIIKEKVKWGQYINLDFDPRFPRLYHCLRKVNRKSHTWNKYSEFLSNFNTKISHKSLFEEDKEITDSFFNYCFCTELNSLPSKRTNNTTTTQLRINFLKHKFYKNFKFVLIAGVSTLGKNKKQQDKAIEKIFNANFNRSINIGSYGKNKIRKANVYYSKEQIIVTCAQLSGAAGWKTGHIPILGKKMNEMKLEE